MANWKKLNEEFDKTLDGLTDADLIKWAENRDQKKAERRKAIISEAKELEKYTELNRLYVSYEFNSLALLNLAGTTSLITNLNQTSIYDSFFGIETKRANWKVDNFGWFDVADKYFNQKAVFYDNIIFQDPTHIHWCMSDYIKEDVAPSFEQNTNPQNSEGFLFMFVA